MNGKNLLLGVIRLFGCWFHVISHLPVKFGVHRTCGIGDITLFICLETTCNQVIKESCDLVRYGPIPQVTTFLSLVVTSLSETEV